MNIIRLYNKINHKSNNCVVFIHVKRFVYDFISGYECEHFIEIGFNRSIVIFIWIMPFKRLFEKEISIFLF
jgi:hypothetical protein